MVVPWAVKMGNSMAEHLAAMRATKKAEQMVGTRVVKLADEMAHH